MDKPYIEKLKDDGNFKGPVFNLKFLENVNYGASLFYREAGLKTEGHFHKGAFAQNDPQEVIMVKGSIRTDYELLNGEKGSLFVNEGEKLIIPKLVYHSYESLTPIVFMEPKSDAYENTTSDTYDYLEFKKLQNGN